MKKILILFIIILSSLGIAYVFIIDGDNKKLSNQMTKYEEKVSPNSVVINDYKFLPSSMRIKKGTTVTWVNRDIAKHNIAVDEKSMSGPSSQLIGKDQKFTYTFTESGTYKYHCDPHPYMKGEIIVTE